MTSLKIVLRQEEKQDGTYPLAIRITKDRRSSYVYLNFSIKESDWNAAEQKVRKSHPNSVRLNNFLLKKLSEATNDALEIETRKNHFSAKAVRNKIKPKTDATVLAQGRDYLDKLKASGKYNQYTADKSRITHFKDFLKGEDVSFSDLTVGLIERFVVFLKSVYKPKGDKQHIGDRSVANHLVTLRSVFAHAAKNEAVEGSMSPFGKGKVKIKFPESSKVGLSIEDVEKLEAVELRDSKDDHARNVWLFSYYFAGMRVSDVFRLKWSDFQQSRLHYTMGKNDKGGSLKIPDKAARILEKYIQFKENRDDLIFPELKGIDLDNKFLTQRTIGFKASAIDKILRKNVAPAAKIDQHLTMHIARHTFGSIAGDAIPIQQLQKLYRHSHVSTTIGYQANFIHKSADDALDAVLSGTTIKPK